MKSNHIANVALSAVPVWAAVSPQSVVRPHAVRLTVSDKRLTGTPVHTPEERGGQECDNSPEFDCREMSAVVS